MRLFTGFILTLSPFTGSKEHVVTIYTYISLCIHHERLSSYYFFNFSKVVSKYLKVSQDKPAHVSVKQEGEFDLLEIHFPLVRETAITQRRGI